MTDQECDDFMRGAQWTPEQIARFRSKGMRIGPMVRNKQRSPLLRVRDAYAQGHQLGLRRSFAALCRAWVKAAMV